MTLFAHRPMVMGRRGAVATGHYLATAAGYRIIQEGGNAVDAAAAAGFCLGVLDQQENSPGGEVPILIYAAEDKRTYAVSGVGWSPKAFSIDWCEERKIDLIPGDGYLPACVPAVVGTWALAVERFGTMSLSRVLKPAIELAERGFPVYDGLRRGIAAHEKKFKERYPTTCEIYLPGGRVPRRGDILRNPDLADTFKKLALAEAEQAHKGRSEGIRAARDLFYRGEIAERIIDFIRNNPVTDDTGGTYAGLLDYDDMAEWQAVVEEPVTLSYRGLDVHKCPTWTQGPVFLQQLALLEGIDLKGMWPHSPDYIHTWIECAKLAFADREAYYGDPAFDDVPFDVLLSEEYNRRRRELIGREASMELRPGDAGRGVPDYVTFDVRADNRRAMGLGGERPDAAAPGGSGGDTTHLDVIDGEGNMVAATPSGGWISDSPVIKGVGFPLGTRGQMFYLDKNRPNALAPRKMPRSTLTPTLVTRDGKPFMVFGMRGGDFQDQITHQFFLNHVEFSIEIQQALDVPWFASEHFPSSFYPRTASPGRLLVDRRMEPSVIKELARRGHKVILSDIPHNTMGIRYDADRGLCMAGVCSTGEHAYALAW